MSTTNLWILARNNQANTIFTLEDFEELYQQGVRIEINDGKITKIVLN